MLKTLSGILAHAKPLNAIATRAATYPRGLPNLRAPVPRVKGGPPSARKLKGGTKKHDVIYRTDYEFTQTWIFKNSMKPNYKKLRTNPYLKVILLEDIPKVGVKGDVVDMEKDIGRKLINKKDKQALYATYENLVAHGYDPEKMKEERRSATPSRLLNYLKGIKVQLFVPKVDELFAESGDGLLITRHDIAEYFFRHRNLVVPYDNLQLLECEDNVIREVGNYKVEVTVTKKVGFEVLVVVQEEKKQMDAEEPDRIEELSEEPDKIEELSQVLSDV